MAQHNKLGKTGEFLAKEFLIRNGYEILAQNWIHQRIEIDIIASDQESIVFVEVKTRASEQWGYPEESVSESKMKRMAEAADLYMRNHDIDKPVRFDIISVIYNKNNQSITHFEDAFLAPLN